MSADWAAIEDALRAWVKAGSGLDDAHLIWAEQTGARPAVNPFITLRLGDQVPIGAIDELDSFTDLGQAAGQEIELRVTGTRSFHVSIQAFAAGVTGANSARAILSRVQTALGLPSLRDALATAGVTPYDEGVVRVVTEPLGTKFESRAVLDVGFYVLETQSERTGYIDTVNATSELGPPGAGTAANIDI